MIFQRSLRSRTFRSAAAFAVLIVAGPSSGVAQHSDLTSEFGPPANPNGNWSYFGVPASSCTPVLLTYGCWSGCVPGGTPQSAYFVPANQCTGPIGGVGPAIYQEQAGQPSGFTPGDVVLVTGGNVIRTVIARWTAPIGGVVRVRGGTWVPPCGVFGPPPMGWAVLHTGGGSGSPILLAHRGYSACPSRACPDLLCLGQTSPCSLDSIAVAQTDTIELVLTYSGASVGGRAGFDFAITYLGTQGIGQASSCFGGQNAAQFTIGAARTGASPGPWATTLVPGGTTLVTICGQSNSPFWVFTGPLNVCWATVPSLTCEGGCIDIGPALTLVYSGQLPGGGVLGVPYVAPSPPLGIAFPLQVAVQHPGASLPSVTAAFVVGLD